MNIAELKAAAEAAVITHQGDWWIADEEDGKTPISCGQHGAFAEVVTRWEEGDVCQGGVDVAPFIALANPATILKLIAVVEAADRYSKFISELQDTTISAEEGDCLDALREARRELEK